MSPFPTRDYAQKNAHSTYSTGLTNTKRKDEWRTKLFLAGGKYDRAKNGWEAYDYYPGRGCERGHDGAKLPRPHSRILGESDRRRICQAVTKEA